MQEENTRIHFSGFTQLCFAAIPAAVGGAALAWLAFVTGCVDLRQQQTLASRMDSRVGVVQPLSAPVTLTIQQPTCLRVDRAFIDGNELTMYIGNHCRFVPRYFALHWDELSPDGTIINGDWTNNGIAMPHPGETAEVTKTLAVDNRVASVRVAVTEADALTD